MDAANVIEFLHLVGKLKHEKRAGWIQMNVSDPETISAHMYRMGMMTFLMDGSHGTDKLNRLHCLQLALVHDLGEAIVGDITPRDGVDVVVKHRLEDEAMQTIAELIGPMGQTVYDLYKEYEAQKTPEAKFVKELDCLDMILQAFEYEKKFNTPKSMEEFFESTKHKFKHPFITKLVMELYAKRNKFAENCSIADPQCIGGTPDKAE